MSTRSFRCLSAAAALVAACGGGDGNGGAQADGGVTSTDAGAPDAAAPDANEPLRLSQVGLYADIGTKVVVGDAIEYAPAFALWSDGAQKTRWLLLPDGAQIDTADMDHWQFPVGARLFKEFVRDGRRVETRMIERTGPGADDYVMAAFIWDAGETDAVITPRGARDVLGTEHDVPSQQQCLDCHEGEPGRVLGFSAVQLSHDGAPNLEAIAAGGLLSAPAAAGASFPPPGNATDVAALGYLHANCGNCHNPTARAFEDSSLVLRLAVDDTEVPQTAAYRTSVGVELERWQEPPFVYRIVAGDASMSAVAHRMTLRTIGMDQMPPLATELVDDSGVSAVSAWIDSLPAPAAAR